MMGALVGLTAQFGVYAHLTWFVFSWDIMEPITFFVGQGAAILFYMYFAFVKRDFTYDEVYSYFYDRKLKRLLAKSGFDTQQHETLRLMIEAAKLDLQQYQQPTFWSD